MSHSKKDAVGGHAEHWIFDDFVGSTSMMGRRWAKKFNRREARREAKKTIREALTLLEADVHDDLVLHNANAEFYHMIYEDHLELERLAAEEEERYAQFEDSYCDPYWDEPYDPYWEPNIDWRFEDSFYQPEPEPEPVTVAYHQLNEPVYAAGESLGEILERMMKKG